MKADKQILNETLENGYYLIREWHYDLRYTGNHIAWHIYYYNSTLKEFNLIDAYYKVTLQLFRSVDKHKRNNKFREMYGSIKLKRIQQYLLEKYPIKFTSYIIKGTYQNFIIEHPEVLI